MLIDSEGMYIPFSTDIPRAVQEMSRYTYIHTLSDPDTEKTRPVPHTNKITNSKTYSGAKRQTESYMDRWTERAHTPTHH